jgi:tetratricopeptide (TPR) repeat protein
VRSPNSEAGGRAALWLVILAASGAAAGLWWTSKRADISFLPELAPAHWIVYPNPPDAVGRCDLELATLFRTSFDLEKVPSQARLRVAGFHRYTLSINGTPIEKPIRTGKNWKQPDVFEVSGQLQPGANRIEVTVVNSNGPPALWLFLDTGNQRVGTGNDWQSSYAGAAWRAAVLASQPKFIPAGSLVGGGEEPWTSLRIRWPTLLLFALLSAAACWVMGRFNRIIPVAVLAGFWVALFANNLGALPSATGFDVDGHMRYITYVQENNSLPLASQGWEMFQPPLYYLVAANLLNLFSLSVSVPSGLIVLRLLGLILGVANFATVWAAMRLLFPDDAAKQRWGLVLAACLPPMLYLSQFVSNEGMAAALASMCLYLCLRVLKQDRASWKGWVGLGLCLGAALLTKTTNVLLVPAIFGALLWRRFEKPEGPFSRWAARVAVMFGLCAVICGWHYARVWLQYGNPLIGNWDPRTGHSWWQDEGYRTRAYYLRFGEALWHPWHAGFRSYGDGFYSTLWGDGMLGGAGRVSTRPPWNFDLMAIGCWLSLLPALAVLVGLLLALLKFIRQPSAEWFLLLGFSFLVAVALLYMSLVVPSGGQSKAFYGLPALVPFCASGALGLGFLAGRNRCWRFVLCLAFGLWAIDSCASFWISRSSVSYARKQARVLITENQPASAAQFLGARLKAEPGPAELRLILTDALLRLGDLDEAERQVQVVLREEPLNGGAWVWRAIVLRQRRQLDQALDAARRSVELAPGSDWAYLQLVSILMMQKRYEEAARMARQGLAIAEFSAPMRAALGTALMFLDQQREASAQFQYAYQLNPGSADRLNDFAWQLATSKDANDRNGAVAVKVAEQACALTEYRNPVYVQTLAAAYAEAGKFDEAIKTAEWARASAVASGQARLVEKSLQMTDLFKSGHPYRAAETPKP